MKIEDKLLDDDEEEYDDDVINEDLLLVKDYDQFPADFSL